MINVEEIYFFEAPVCLGLIITVHVLAQTFPIMYYVYQSLAFVNMGGWMDGWMDG